MHTMKSRSERGHGSWKQCKDCGATYHGKLWWLGGFKSKEEPPCTLHGIDAKWKYGAEQIDLNEI